MKNLGLNKKALVIPILGFMILSVVGIYSVNAPKPPSLESRVMALETKVTELEATITNLVSRIATLESEMQTHTHDYSKITNTPSIPTENDIITLVKDNAISREPDYDS